ncbi:MAG: PQQ-binding-like beta-propeller repeat protein [Verrucomicrobia bacterium]|nr:PQQ-binding-like beta-propeller repeat protein [Verrucomicrobiota bacterium]
MSNHHRSVKTAATNCLISVPHLWSRVVLGAGLSLLCMTAPAKDWPQWGGTFGKNMVSEEKGLPESFVPGEKDTVAGQIKLETAKNVKWGVKLCAAIYSTPSVVNGKIFIGGRDPGLGLLLCLDAKTGQVLWRWQGPARKVATYIDGFHIGIGPNPEALGVCSTPFVEDNRVYFVTHSFKVMCLDANGQPPGPEAGQARVIWEFDLWDKLGVFPCDAVNGSPLIDGDLLYVQTSNGVDRNMGPAKELQRKFPAPDAPNLIVLDKKTGRLVATDDLRIAGSILHGQWAAVSLGKVAGRKQIYFGGGDGRCYAFEALSSVPTTPAKLKVVWSFDCIPPEYRSFGGLDAVSHYCLGDKRTRDTLNKNDGTFVGESEIIATPVFFKDRIYVPIGRDPEHGRGRGAMHCLDATKTGDITRTGRLWTYQGLDRTLSTVSIADGLLYVCDVGGRLHCLDAETGQCHWVHETTSTVWGSTLVADGKVFMPTPKGLFVLATGKEKKVLSQINVGSTIYATPVVANGTLYIASRGGWLWAVSKSGTE